MTHVERTWNLHAHTHAHEHTHTCTHTLACTHMHTNTRTHIHMHARTHTHAHTLHLFHLAIPESLLLFNCLVLSDSLWPHGLQHARLPCPSPSPGACSNSCPSSRWCHPTISSSVLCHPLLLLPTIFPRIRVFSNESAFHIRWPKYWSFSFLINPSNEYSELISFRIDWFDLAVQGTLKSLIDSWEHHNLKASILWPSAFFMVQLSHPVHDYWKNHSFDYTRNTRAFIIAQLVKNLPAI